MSQYKGRKKGAIANREWSEALRRAVSELRAVAEDGKGPKIKALVLLARKVVNRALDGDMTAAKEIGDRLDGRPTQGVELAVETPITKIERVIVDALPQVIEGEVIDVVTDALLNPDVSEPE